jgi:hypothetical protein
VIFFIDISLPLGVAAGVPYILVILLLLKHAKTKLIYFFAVLASVLTIIGFTNSPSGGELWKVIFNRSLAIFAVWTTTILGIQRESAMKKREKALTDLQVLQGMLPICSSCKKIRDEKGNWNQLERYIQKHSEAEFTHGLCLDCAKQLFPDVDLSDR